MVVEGHLHGVATATGDAGRPGGVAGARIKHRDAGDVRGGVDRGTGLKAGIKCPAAAEGDRGPLGVAAAGSQDTDTQDLEEGAIPEHLDRGPRSKAIDATDRGGRRRGVEAVIIHPHELDDRVAFDPEDAPLATGMVEGGGCVEAGSTADHRDSCDHAIGADGVDIGYQTGSTERGVGEVETVAGKIVAAAADDGKPRDDASPGDPRDLHLGAGAGDDREEITRHVAAVGV